ncbi:conjugal transfer protein TraH [Thiomicrolovo sp. ZZH C-3]
MRIATLSLAAILLFNTAHAGSVADFYDQLQSDLGDYAYINGTPGGEWTDPSTGATYYSAGSLEFRFKTNANYQPWMQVRSPSVNSGCNAISFDFGFVSLMNIEDIGQQLQQAGLSLLGGFMSQLLYSTPILGEIMAKVNAITREIQALMQDACSIGKNLGNKTKSAVADSAIAKMFDADPQQAVTNTSKNEDEKTLYEYVDSGVQSALDAVKCFRTTANGDDCSGVAAGDGNTILAAAIKTSTPVSSTPNPIIKSGIVFNKKKDAFLIKIKSSDFFQGTSPESGVGVASFVGEAKEILKILFAVAPLKVESGAVCAKAEDAYVNLNNTEEPAALTQFIKGQLADQQKLAESVQVPQPLKQVIPLEQFANFVINGYIDGNETARGSYKIPSFNLYITQIPASQPTEGSAAAEAAEPNGQRLERRIMVCGAHDDAGETIKWQGVSNVEDVIGQIEHIAYGTGANNPNVLLTSEVAAAADALKKRQTMLEKKLLIYPTGAMDVNILAAYNNYLITQRFVQGMANLVDQFSESTTADAVTGVSGMVGDLQSKLQGLRENMASALSAKIGADQAISSYETRLRADIHYIEGAYKENTAKMRRN